MRLIVAAAAAALALAPTGAWASSFINGGFETGDASGWTSTTGYRGYVDNAGLASTTPTGATNHSAVVSAGTVDSRVGPALGDTVYAGNYSYRVEDIYSGGYASLLTQTVTNYTDANNFIVWKAVLDGAHGVNDAATLIIKLTDITTNTDLITRTYNAASSGGGVDSRWSSLNGYYYTADWQIEQLAIGTGLSGHSFLLSVLAADCEPTGHLGYAYVDGFGAVQGGSGDPGDVGAVPEPATWAMMILGFGAIGSAMRRSRRKLLPTLSLA